MSVDQDGFHDEVVQIVLDLGCRWTGIFLHRCCHGSSRTIMCLEDNFVRVFLSKLYEVLSVAEKELANFLFARSGEGWICV